MNNQGTTQEALEAENAELTRQQIEDWRVDLLCGYTSETTVDTYGQERADRYRAEINSLCDMALRASAAEAESARLREALEKAAKVCERSSGVNAIPETDDYANGWNDCRKEAFSARQRDAAAIRALAPSGEQR